MRDLFVAVALLFGSVCSQQALAKPNFAKFDARPSNGGVLFLTPLLPQQYSIWISQVAADGKPAKTQRLSVSPGRVVMDPATGSALILVSLPPGQHLIRLILVQEHWGACLAQNTVSFSVQPGSIAYLGRFQPERTIKSLEGEIVRTGKTSAIRTQLRMFRNNLVAPAYSLDGAPKAADLLGVARANGVDASFPLVEAHATPATFPSPEGSDMIGYCD
jgi:hypothetical protein